MAQPRAASQIAAAPAQPRYTPRATTIHSRRRFNTRRKKEYQSQIAGSPTPWQTAAIESLIRREWIAITAERSDDPDAALRADREYQKLLADFRRSLSPATAAKPETPEQIMQRIRAARDGQEGSA